jgi:hypothetical protein
MHDPHSPDSMKSKHGQATSTDEDDRGVVVDSNRQLRIAGLVIVSTRRWFKSPAEDPRNSE